jgi:hypothetical protein
MMDIDLELWFGELSIYFENNNDKLQTPAIMNLSLSENL